MSGPGPVGDLGVMSILGNRVRRVEDPALLTAGGTYVADVSDPLLDGAVAAHYVRSPVAAGPIESIDVDDALAAPGVLAVVTAADLADLPLLPVKIPMFAPEVMHRPWLAVDEVRFVGEPVAVVVAETAAQAADAAGLVWADIDPSDAVVDPTTAATAAPVAASVAANHFHTWGERSEGDAIFADCDVVVRARVHHQRLAACPIEGRAAAAAWDGNRPVLWISNQGAFGVKHWMQEVYPDADPRVIVPDVGGGFGPKIDASQEEVLLPWLARHVGRPVRWIETRSENMVAMGHGRAHVHDVALGGSAAGDLEAYRLEITADAGAYAALGAWLPMNTRLMAQGTYDIPTVEVVADLVLTNTMSTVAYRGAGRPEATLSIERAVDLFAAEAGLDAVAVRRRNLIGADQFPFVAASGATYDVGDYEAALDAALAAADHVGLRREQQRRRDEGAAVELGIGVASYVEVTAPAGDGERETARVDIGSDGSVRVTCGAGPTGQGHATAWSMLVSETLGVDLEQIEVVHGDTDTLGSGWGTWGSRSLQVGGSAVRKAATELVDVGRHRAADELGVPVYDVEFSGGVFASGGGARTWADLAGPDGFGHEVTFDAAGSTFPFGAHVAVVEVDTDTGAVTLRSLTAVDDAGTILNPMLAEGQRHGGIAQGVAQALFEEMHYDDDGNPQTATFLDYGIPSAAELCSFDLVAMATPTPVNDLGAKGIGESGTIGSTPAVINAVMDALATRGVRHIDPPLTPHRVWSALHDASSPKEIS